MKITLSKIEELKLEFVSRLLKTSKPDLIRQMIQDTHAQILKNGYNTNTMKEWAFFVKSREEIND